MFCLFSFISCSILLLHSVFKLFDCGVKKLPLPPGSLGWPYIGETFQLYSQNPSFFFASKVKKLVLNFLDFLLGILDFELLMSNGCVLFCWKKQVWFNFQDSHIGMSMCDDIKPRSSKTCFGH